MTTGHTGRIHAPYRTDPNHFEAKGLPLLLSEHVAPRSADGETDQRLSTFATGLAAWLGGVAFSGGALRARRGR
jgi:hypothetical protein